MPAPGIVAKPWVSIPTTSPITLSRVNQMLASARRLCAISPLADPLVFDSNELPYVYQFPRHAITACCLFICRHIGNPASRRSISACTDPRSWETLYKGSNTVLGVMLEFAIDWQVDDPDESEQFSRSPSTKDASTLQV